MNIYVIVGFLLSIKLPSRNFNPWTRFDGKYFRLDFHFSHMSSFISAHYFYICKFTTRCISKKEDIFKPNLFPSPSIHSIWRVDVLLSCKLQNQKEISQASHKKKKGPLLLHHKKTWDSARPRALRHQHQQLHRSRWTGTVVASTRQFLFNPVVRSDTLLLPTSREWDWKLQNQNEQRLPSACQIGIRPSCFTYQRSSQRTNKMTIQPIRRTKTTLTSTPSSFLHLSSIH